MACGVKGCGVGLHRTSEHYDGWGEAALQGVILGLTKANEDLLGVLCALGVLPDGFCFCHDAAQQRSGHAGECRDARRVLAAHGLEVGHYSPAPCDGCDGRGRWEERVADGTEEGHGEEVCCEKCAGTGTVNRD